MRRFTSSRLSPVICHVSCVKCHMSLFLKQNGEAFSWRVCYQQCRPIKFFIQTTNPHMWTLNLLTCEESRINTKPMLINPSIPPKNLKIMCHIRCGTCLVSHDSPIKKLKCKSKVHWSFRQSSHFFSPLGP